MAAVVLLGSDQIVNKRKWETFITAGNVIGISAGVILGLATYTLLTGLLDHLFLPVMAAPVHLVMGWRPPAWSKFIGDASQLGLRPVTQAIVRWTLIAFIVAAIVSRVKFGASDEPRQL